MTHLKSDRFSVESGTRITVQVPIVHKDEVVAAVRSIDPLIWGDYDTVTFTTSVGEQGFRALGSGRNSATDEQVTVPCVELSFFVVSDPVSVIEAIYHVHPYEEPVIFVTEATRTLHIRGMDEDNPNRFWNRADQNWVPEEHR